MAYLGKTPSQGVRNRYYFTATGGETSLSGTDDNGNTLTYTDGNYVDVSLNGVSLVAGTDYNTTTANTIGGLTALTASDVVEIVVYDTFSVFSGAFTGDISLGDNVKAKFGAGDDLQIYHDSSNSVILDNGTGGLRLQTNSLRVLKADASENIIQGTADGSVILYHNNIAKLTTASTGIDVTGTVTFDGGTTSADLNFGDNVKAQFGASNDLQIFHDGSNSYVQDAGTGGMRLGSDSIVQIGKATAWGELMASFTPDGGCELRHDNAAKLNTSSTGIDVTGTVTADGILNNNKSEFFASEAALVSTGSTAKVYATNSTFDGVNGSLVLQSRPTSGADVYIATGSTPKTVAKFNDGGDIAFYDSTGVTQGLFWDASTQRLGLGTTSPATALDVNGTVTATTDTDTTNTGSVTLDFGANQNFVLTLTGNVTLVNPTTEQVGQSGFIVFIQDATGGRTVSLGTDYETAGGAGLTLSTAASATDIVPYVVAASGRILLGAPQLAFA